MERLAMAALGAWRDNPTRKPLVLRGVRQCGKTWLLREFANRYFPQQVYLNFEKEPGLAGLFADDLDPRRIVRDLSILRGQRVDPGDTLIIMDEVQACPVALMSLKYFCEDAPEFFVAAAGSLLGLAEHGEVGFPVGKVDFVDLGPLTFQEFLLATDDAMLAEYIATLMPGDRVSSPLAAKAESLLKQYLIVGGMPEPVASWLADHDLERVETIQQAILDSYALDMVKHAGAAVLPKLMAVWRSIPRQLAKENQKFIFSQVIGGARAKDLEGALEWLVAAGIVVKVARVSQPACPLPAFADDRYFKLYLADVGLLRRLAELPAAALLQPSGSRDFFTGALVGNYVLAQLLATVSKTVFFWRSDNTAEVDFLVQVGQDVVPLEVKSGDNAASKSLAEYVKRFAPRHALKLTMKPTVNGHLPLWAAWNIPQYLASCGSLVASTS